MMGIMIIFMISIMYKVNRFGGAHVKSEQEQVAEHRHGSGRRRAFVPAARLSTTSPVADVMKEAGLTHGAFYGYFPSKKRSSPGGDRAKPCPGSG